MVQRKTDLEIALREERLDIAAGRLKEDSPLDTSRQFREFCEICRRGDVKACEEYITNGININARDRFDYTPLILASLCGHYEIVKVLLEAGALCERDTFQGERCLYNALNDATRNLLLSYNYSKSTGTLQPLALHISSLLRNSGPRTSDIALKTCDSSLNLHKFILSARSPYLAKKFKSAPETNSWKLHASIPTTSVELAVKYLYLGEITLNFGHNEEDEAILTGLDKVSRQLGIDNLLGSLLDARDVRTARQQRTAELSRARDQLAAWFESNIIENKIVVDTEKVGSVIWTKDNPVYADILLRADSDDDLIDAMSPVTVNHTPVYSTIPIGGFPLESPSNSQVCIQNKATTTIYPVHRAMLSRSQYFSTMFASNFREAQESTHLRVITVDCSSEVLEIILRYLYAENTDFPLSFALDVLYTADLLLLDKLKQRAATVITTLGGDQTSQSTALKQPSSDTSSDEMVDMYDVIRAGWDTRVPKLESFGAQYIAGKLEEYIDDEEFANLVRESAGRIKGRQEVDSIELIDDIRHYLAERFGVNGADRPRPSAEVEFERRYNENDQVEKGTKLEEYNRLLDKIDDLLDNLDLEG